jgi:hypothetical protein
VDSPKLELPKGALETQVSENLNVETDAQEPKPVSVSNEKDVRSKEEIAIEKKFLDKYKFITMYKD